MFRLPTATQRGPILQNFSTSSYWRLERKEVHQPWTLGSQILPNRYNGIICIFGPKKGHFRQLGPYNGLPSSQTATFRKTEGIQSYLRICGCYDLIKSGSSEPKKKGFYGCSAKKSDFRAIFGPKMGSCSPPGARSAT